MSASLGTSEGVEVKRFHVKENLAQPAAWNALGTQRLAEANSHRRG